MKEMTVEAVPSSIPVVTGFINNELKALGCSFKTQAEIDVAVDEMLANIAFYAYAPDTGTATVRLEVEEEPRTVVITFLDHGIPFNPLERRDPKVRLPAAERKIGGLGIYIVKKCMDSVTYRYKDGENILQIKKKL